MTDQVLSPHRRRAAVSLSESPPSSEPVEQLDWAVEILHRVNRALPETVLDREELIALGGLLTQVSTALLTFTDLLIPAVHHYDRIRLRNEHAAPTRQDVVTLLRDCRNSYVAAHAAARAFHAGLKH